MSYADVVSQMQAIDATFAQLGLTAQQQTSGASAASFASALDGATAAGPVSTSATASTQGALVSPNGVTGNDVVQAAMQYKGVPYVLGGESKSGIDCSGLVQAAFKQVGVSVPRLVHQQQELGTKVDSLKDAKPGDLIVLNGGDHIAIYLGNDTVIHAPYPGRTVSVQKAWFTDKDITTIRRVVPASGDTAAASTGAPVAGATAAGVSAAAGATTPSGLSASAAAQATAMLTTYGADVGMYDASGGSSGGSSDGSGSLAGLLSSFGLTGSSSGASSSAVQQLIAARSALLPASA